MLFFDLSFSDWKVSPPDRLGQVSNPLFEETLAKTMPFPGEQLFLKSDELKN